MTKLTASAIALVLALGLAACGDDDSDGDNASSTPAASTPTQSGPATGGEEVKISMKDIKYIPAAATIDSGQKVTWTNDDPVAHTVTAQGNFDSGTVEPGGKYSRTFSKPGKIDYVCTIHPNQTGTITVR